MHEDCKDRRRRTGRKHDWLADGGEAPRTPLGNVVASRFDALSERMEADLRAAGHGPHSPCSSFRLQALYVDFGRKASTQELIDAVRAAFEAAQPRAAATGDARLKEATRYGLGDLDDLTGWGSRLSRLSRRALMTALVFNTHFWNIQLALEVVAGERPVERFAIAMCAFVAEQRVGHGLDGDPRYYAPLGERDPAFCYNSCLPVIRPLPSEDRPCLPERTPITCGMLRVLEGFRFFAAFPDEP